MGKKSKRSTKTGNEPDKKGAGKTRREKIAALKDIDARITALVENLEKEHEEKDVFAPISKREDCPICLVPMPAVDYSLKYATRACFPCCSMQICKGCIFAQTQARVNLACPFCRAPIKHSKNDGLKMVRQRAEANDPEALHDLAKSYAEEDDKCDVQQDCIAAMQLYLQAAELGNVASIIDIAYKCRTGYAGKLGNAALAIRLATAIAKTGCMRGHALLGYLHFLDWNIEAEIPYDNDKKLKAIKHWAYAAKAGDPSSMKSLEQLCDDLEIYLEGCTLDEVKRDFDEAKKLEWTEERERAYAIDRMG